jgi:DNA recombination protein RmuC
MDNFTALIVIIVLGFAVVIFFLNKKMASLQNNSTDAALLEWLKSMQASINTTSESTVRTLQENSKQLNERLDKAAAVIRDVNVSVGQMSEIGRSMKDLQDFLKSPKLRGNIGEQVLKDLITQIFPKNSFNLQYTFLSGEKVDAAIKTDAGILPIDAKFPMENFQKLAKSKTEEEIKLYRKEFERDIKKHIDSIAKKYILPDEGTMDFALMYVPSESVFYEIVNMEEITEHAKSRRIYIVSPSTLYAHLQTILLSFEGKKIEQESRQLFRLLRSLQIDYEKVNESLDTLGKHLGNASNQYMNVNKGLTGLGQKLSSAKNLGGEIKKEIGTVSDEQLPFANKD